MIVLAAILGVTLTVPLLGGRYSRLAQLRFRAFPLLTGALAIQILVLQVASETIPAAAASCLHVASYGLVGFFLWCNRHVPGLWLIAAGGAANAVAIAANGGVMPATAAARTAAGLADTPGFSNSDVVDGARLAFLGDIFAWPAPLPLANVFSVGDVLLVIGAAFLLHRACGSRLPLGVSRTPRRQPQPD